MKHSSQMHRHSAASGGGRVNRHDVESVLTKARDFLFAIQSEDGHWCGELEGDTILASEYILTFYFLGQQHDESVRKAAQHIRNEQLPDGAWAIYPGGPPEVSASVKAYFVLKLLGDDPSSPQMRRAAETIIQLGGIEACNSFTKILLAIFGQCTWDRCPAVLPELILLPRWFYFNIYDMSAWSRAILIPLSIIWAHKPFRDVPPEAHITELYVGASSTRPPNAPATTFGNAWALFFTRLDRVMKRMERLPYKPLRKLALSRAEAWIRHRLEKSDGLGAIFPPIVNTIMAFDCLGYPSDHSIMVGQIRELKKLIIEEEDSLRVQPCFSPVWDTSLILNAMLESGLEPDHPLLLKAGRFLMRKEVREAGDWKYKNPKGPIGGWYFEFANEYYPDCDDTAEVITALSRLRFPDPGEEKNRIAAMQRGQNWLRSMQNRDGGWAAFDKNCNKEPLTYVPFADHNAMIDPSNDDITGRTLKALVLTGVASSSSAVRKGVHYLQTNQEPDGTWYGRWGCNYIYGSWLALWGLRCAGEDVNQHRYTQIIDWLRSHQNEDGGWGESLRSFDDPELKGKGKSTAAQTAWALMIFFAFDRYDLLEVGRGVGYLLKTQLDNGSWKDEFWTATGFPKVFYLNYHLYATCFPYLALSTYQKHRPEANQPDRTALSATAIQHEFLREDLPGSSLGQEKSPAIRG